MRHGFLCLLCGLVLTCSALAATEAPTADYPAMAQDIQKRLDLAAQLYAKQDAAGARSQIQGAYFEVFENLEGPIRINLSAQKSAEMEAAFGDIRKMIGDGRPLGDVEARIGQLKREIDATLPHLSGGHQLVAEGQHGGYEDDRILPHWRQSLRVIDDRLAEAMAAHEAGQVEAVRQKIQQAQYDGYKNSELEIAVRQFRSSEQSSAINKQFNTLMTLAEQHATHAEFGYEITNLLQDVSDLLPDLPATRDDQNPKPAAVETQRADADWHKVVADIDSAMAAAIAQYGKGDAGSAIAAVQDGYFDLFEASGMENKVGARDAGVKSTLEGYFTRMVSLMKAGRPASEVAAQATALKADLDKAVTMLDGVGNKQGSSGLFVYSLLIILREGLEALLIVAAIVAYLVKNGHRDKQPLIRQSVYVALGASLVTAFLFQLLFANSGASRELLEGVTMLIAVLMLFSMSYWLLSKIEARHWKAYLEGKLSRSLSKGSLVGLWLTSFLAVYREGAETVLFYFALFGDASSPGDTAYILAGFAVGCVLLLAAYLAMRYSIVRLPLKPFFLVTGSFMYLMAFVFAGKGVLELIEGKLFQPTLLSGVPEIGWLGIYPYAETLMPQAVLIVAALVALWVMARRRTSFHAPQETAAS
ncbi:MAG: FTR1 family iron permease [Propionivibrio sp.]